MSCLTVLSRTSVAASMRPLSMDPDRSTMKATSRGFSTSLLTTLDDPKAEKVAWKTPPPGALGGVGGHRLVGPHTAGKTAVEGFLVAEDGAEAVGRGGVGHPRHGLGRGPRRGGPPGDDGRHGRCQQGGDPAQARAFPGARLPKEPEAPHVHGLSPSCLYIECA